MSGGHNKYLEDESSDSESDIDIDIHELARTGTLLEVKEAIVSDRARLVAAKDKFGRTALHYAAAFSRVDIMFYLLGKGANINARDKKEQTPLHVTSARGLTNICRILLEYDAKLNLKDKDGWTALHHSVDGRFYETATLLVKRGIQINAEDHRHGRTALHLCAEKGFFEFAEMLIIRGADLYATGDDFYGKTPLHLACEHGHEETVRILLKRGSNMSAFSGFLDKTPLHLACEMGHLGCVKLLVEHGANLTLIGSRINGSSALHIAASKGFLEIVRFLVEYCSKQEEKYAAERDLDLVPTGPPPVAVTDSVDFELSISPPASKSNKLETSNSFAMLALTRTNSAESFTLKQQQQQQQQEFLDKPLPEPPQTRNFPPVTKAQLLEQTGRFTTIGSALHVACANGRKECAALLLDLGSDINARDEDRHTALHIACKCSFFDLAMMLIYRGADPYPKAYNGKTPLDYVKLPTIKAGMQVAADKAEKDRKNKLRIAESKRRKEEAAQRLRDQEQKERAIIAREESLMRTHARHRYLSALKAAVDVSGERSALLAVAEDFPYEDINVRLDFDTLSPSSASMNAETEGTIMLLDDNKPTTATTTTTTTTLSTAAVGKSEQRRTKSSEKNSTTALIRACERGFTQLVFLLLEWPGLLLNVQDSLYGNTALHYAAINGDMEVCQQLMLCEVKTGIMNKEGKVAANMAKTNYLREVLRNPSFMKQRVRYQEQVMRDIFQRSRRLLLDPTKQQQQMDGAFMNSDEDCDYYEDGVAVAVVRGERGSERVGGVRGRGSVDKGVNARSVRGSGGGSSMGDEERKATERDRTGWAIDAPTAVQKKGPGDILSSGRKKPNVVGHEGSILNDPNQAGKIGKSGNWADDNDEQRELVDYKNYFYADGPENYDYFVFYDENGKRCSRRSRKIYQFGCSTSEKAVKRGVSKGRGARAMSMLGSQSFDASAGGGVGVVVDGLRGTQSINNDRGRDGDTAGYLKGTVIPFSPPYSNTPKQQQQQQQQQQQPPSQPSARTTIAATTVALVPVLPAGDERLRTEKLAISHPENDRPDRNSTLSRIVHKTPLLSLNSATTAKYVPSHTASPPLQPLSAPRADVVGMKQVINDPTAEFVHGQYGPVPAAFGGCTADLFLKDPVPHQMPVVSRADATTHNSPWLDLRVLQQSYTPTAFDSTIEWLEVRDFLWLLGQPYPPPPVSLPHSPHHSQALHTAKYTSDPTSSQPGNSSINQAISVLQQQENDLKRQLHAASYQQSIPIVNNKASLCHGSNDGGGGSSHNVIQQGGRGSGRSGVAVVGVVAAAGIGGKGYGYGYLPTHRQGIPSPSSPSLYRAPSLSELMDQPLLHLHSPVSSRLRLLHPHSLSFGSLKQQQQLPHSASFHFPFGSFIQSPSSPLHHLQQQQQPQQQPQQDQQQEQQYNYPSVQQQQLHSGPAYLPPIAGSSIINPGSPYAYHHSSPSSTTKSHPKRVKSGQYGETISISSKESPRATEQRAERTDRENQQETSIWAERPASGMSVNDKQERNQEHQLHQHEQEKGEGDSKAMESDDFLHGRDSLLSSHASRQLNQEIAKEHTNAVEATVAARTGYVNDNNNDNNNNHNESAREESRERNKRERLEREVVVSLGSEYSVGDLNHQQWDDEGSGYVPDSVSRDRDISVAPIYSPTLPLPATAIVTADPDTTAALAAPFSRQQWGVRENEMPEKSVFSLDTDEKTKESATMSQIRSNLWHHPTSSHDFLDENDPAKGVGVSASVSGERGVSVHETSRVSQALRNTDSNVYAGKSVFSITTSEGTASNPHTTAAAELAQIQQQQQQQQQQQRGEGRAAQTEQTTTTAASSLDGWGEMLHPLQQPVHGHKITAVTAITASDVESSVHSYPVLPNKTVTQQYHQQHQLPYNQLSSSQREQYQSQEAPSLTTGPPINNNNNNNSNKTAIGLGYADDGCEKAILYSSVGSAGRFDETEKEEEEEENVRGLISISTEGDRKERAAAVAGGAGGGEGGEGGHGSSFVLSQQASVVTEDPELLAMAIGEHGGAFSAGPSLIIEESIPFFPTTSAAPQEEGVSDQNRKKLLVNHENMVDFPQSQGLEIYSSILTETLASSQDAEYEQTDQADVGFEVEKEVEKGEKNKRAHPQVVGTSSSGLLLNTIHNSSGMVFDDNASELRMGEMSVDESASQISEYASHFTENGANYSVSNQRQQQQQQATRLHLIPANSTSHSSIFDNQNQNSAEMVFNDNASELKLGEMHSVQSFAVSSVYEGEEEREGEREGEGESLSVLQYSEGSSEEKRSVSVREGEREESAQTVAIAKTTSQYHPRRQQQQEEEEREQQQQQQQQQQHQQQQQQQQQQQEEEEREQEESGDLFPSSVSLASFSSAKSPSHKTPSLFVAPPTAEPPQSLHTLTHTPHISIASSPSRSHPIAVRQGRERGKQGGGRGGVGGPEYENCLTFFQIAQFCTILDEEERRKDALAAYEQQQLELLEQQQQQQLLLLANHLPTALNSIDGFAPQQQQQQQQQLQELQPVCDERWLLHVISLCMNKVHRVFTDHYKFQSAFIIGSSGNEEGNFAALPKLVADTSTKMSEIGENLGDNGREIASMGRRGVNSLATLSGEEGFQAIEYTKQLENNLKNSPSVNSLYFNNDNNNNSAGDRGSTANTGVNKTMATDVSYNYFTQHHSSLSGKLIASYYDYGGGKLPEKPPNLSDFAYHKLILVTKVLHCFVRVVLHMHTPPGCDWGVIMYNSEYQVSSPGDRIRLLRKMKVFPSQLEHELLKINAFALSSDSNRPKNNNNNINNNNSLEGEGGERTMNGSLQVSGLQMKEQENVSDTDTSSDSSDEEIDKNSQKDGKLTQLEENNVKYGQPTGKLALDAVDGASVESGEGGKSRFTDAEKVLRDFKRQQRRIEREKRRQERRKLISLGKYQPTDAEIEESDRKKRARRKKKRQRAIQTGNITAATTGAWQSSAADKLHISDLFFNPPRYLRVLVDALFEVSSYLKQEAEAKYPLDAVRSHLWAHNGRKVIFTRKVTSDEVMRQKILRAQQLQLLREQSENHTQQQILLQQQQQQPEQQQQQRSKNRKSGKTGQSDAKSSEYDAKSLRETKKSAVISPSPRGGKRRDPLKNGKVLSKTGDQLTNSGGKALVLPEIVPKTPPTARMMDVEDVQEWEREHRQNRNLKTREQGREQGREQDTSATNRGMGGDAATRTTATSRPAVTITSLQLWLSDLRLIEYEAYFLDLGFKILSDFSGLSEADCFEYFPFLKIGDLRRLAKNSQFLSDAELTKYESRTESINAGLT